MRDMIRSLWAHRRWLYGAWLLFAVSRIAARVGFHLAVPRCDTRLTLTNAALSMTKVPHIVLFGAFCVLTILQFDRFNLRALSWSILATALLGLIVELEEGASRTGNCRLTDLLPDVVGALIAGAIFAATLALLRARHA